MTFSSTFFLNLVSFLFSFIARNHLRRELVEDGDGLFGYVKLLLVRSQTDIVFIHYDIERFTALVFFWALRAQLPSI